MKKRIAILVVAATIGLSQSGLSIQPQSAQRSVLDRVYTPEQAGRGESLVVETIGCVNCHGSTLRGGAGDTPPLVGPEFISKWQGFTLDDLETKLTTMPPNRSDTLNPQDYVDIMTFLLQLNGFPSGDEELVPNAEVLRQIKIVAPQKPE